MPPTGTQTTYGYRVSGLGTTGSMAAMTALANRRPRPASVDSQDSACSSMSDAA